MQEGPNLPVDDRSPELRRHRSERRDIAFRFTGKASEYFRIWIVNTLLTIVTLGVYSAWAKIRTKQYFYRNTWLDGSSFEYLAKPIPILKGRLIAAAALGSLFAAHSYSLNLYFGLLLVYVLATPWVVTRALAFNARNSAFRNIRFAFVGRASEAWGVYLGMVLFQLVTCGLGYPYAQWRMTGFFIKRHLFGDLEFGWNSKSKDYYRAYLAALVLALPAYVIFMVLGFAAARGATPGAEPKALSPVMIATMGLVYLYFLVPGAVLRARIANLVYGGVHIGPHRLSSKQRWDELLKLYALNAVAVVFSLGLLIPWAKIRMAAYRAERLTLHADGDISAETLFNDETGAVGEGLSDLGDFDLGIGT
jgi:uncharacterized membrane protein YjgN (DUF898 family)